MPSFSIRIRPHQGQCCCGNKFVDATLGAYSLCVVFGKGWNVWTTSSHVNSISLAGINRKVDLGIGSELFLYE
jgi:hypothetical protein